MHTESNEHTFASCHEPGLSHCRKVLFSVLSLAILLLLIYGNSFDCSWQFDDEPNITDNSHLHLDTLTWEGIKRAIFSDRNNPGFPYRPVACLTFAFNYYFGGLDVFGYHLVNLVIHWLSSVFLFLFIYHSLNLSKLRDKYGPDSYSLALLATVFWAINPVQVQAVTYIVQRMASLAGLFFILGMYLYLKARTTSNPTQTVLFFILCFISFLLALGSKENAAMLPVVIFTYETLLIQRNPFLFLRSNLKLILFAVGFTLLIGLSYFYFKDGSIFSFLKGYETNRPFSFQERLLTQPRVILFYISLLIYPITDRLNIAHSIAFSKSLIDPISTLLSFFIITLLLFIAIYRSSKNPLVSFCIIFFFLNHIIESSIFPLEIIFEHRNYIPSMLFFLPFAIGFVAVCKKYRTKRITRYALAAFVSLLMTGFGHAVHLRNFDWKTPGTLWADSVAKSPDIFRPHHNLAKWYDDNGDMKKALAIYKEALTKTANNRQNEKFITYFNLGNLFNRTGKQDKAISNYEKAIRLNPGFSPTYNNLAVLFSGQGKHEISNQYTKKALQLSPEDPATNLNVGLINLKYGLNNKAIYHFKKALATKDTADKALFYLGIAYKKKGLLGRATVLFQKSLVTAPRNIHIRLHLAETYYRAGLFSNAEEQADRALALLPNKQALNNMVNELLSEPDPLMRKIKPDKEIVIPLLKKACTDKAAILVDWSMLLDVPPSVNVE